VPLAQGLVPNANTAAMMPMPHVAGTASAIIGTITMAGGALLGGLVSGAFDGTVRPFALGVFTFMSIAAALILFGATTRGHDDRRNSDDANSDTSVDPAAISG
jgi:DHA1 family bicyclomycin/chloramphenicol resistance-like MFS transporter